MMCERKLLMNRFMVFTGNRYYPEGGLWDLKGTASTLEEAMKIDVNGGFGGGIGPDWGYIAEYNGADFDFVKTWDVATKGWKTDVFDKYPLEGENV